MPDLNTMLNALRHLPERPPAAPTPLSELSRRAGQIHRRRTMAIFGTGAVALLAIGGFALVSGSGDAVDGNVQAGPDPVAEPTTTTAASLLDEVLTLAEENAYFATPEMLDRWRTEADQVTADAAAPADVYPFVNRIVGELDASAGRSSHGFWAPDRAAAFAEWSDGTAPESPAPLFDSSIGYLEVTPANVAAQSDEGLAYVEAVRAAFANQACGWIIDLRADYQSSRSTIDTMLSAVAPLLPPGPAVTFRSRDGADTSLVVGSDGSVSNSADGSVVAPAAGDGSSVAVPVAILQGPSTTQTYELLLLAFRGRAGTATFGTPSAGQSVANEAFPLSDGSLLWLTTGIAADRTASSFDGPIQPDVAVPAAATPQAEDQAREAAQAWLAQQPSCQQRL